MCEPDSDQDVPPPPLSPNPTADLPLPMCWKSPSLSAAAAVYRAGRSACHAASPSPPPQSKLPDSRGGGRDHRHSGDPRPEALLDSGASGLFLHIRFVREHASLPGLSLAHPRQERRRYRECRRAITEVVDLVLRYNGHSEQTDPVPDSEDADTMEEGDRLLATALFGYPAAEEIRASQTTSQRLAEAFARNSAPKDFRDAVPITSTTSRTSGLPSVERVTVKNHYPLPLISELINNLRGARYFTKLDVRWGYNNVRIKEGDEWKATFRTNRGLFEPLVILRTHQQSGHLPDDDERHLPRPHHAGSRLNTAHHPHRLDRLREHRLFLKPEKCEFERTEIEYLGLIISHGTASMDPVKVAGVAEWPTPKNKKEVQFSLGFTNFYRRFIRDFSHHTRPLFDLTAKDVAWTWAARRRTTTAPSESKPTARTSPRARAVPTVAGGREMAPGRVLFKSLNTVERNYEIHDKEMLAIIRALEEWRHFLEYGQADALSRRPDHGDGSSDNADIVLLKPEFFAVRALQGLIAAGEENQILRDIRRGNHEGAQEDVVAEATAALKSAHSGVRSVCSAEWSEDQGFSCSGADLRPQRP
ncbi:putative reverse transcriptase-rnase h-integrase [Lyophyllum shimeji]|uniref:Reverse transcriptase-rnase h-integrase n=1 Tax=Lyophyllum shimeji TaxID=47721 RepID=A0A9P3PXW8_LYOSH|nr:putative reverse transcriptase-rnase h-integrase [Lyophyllum shimeji]